MSAFNAGTPGMVLDAVAIILGWKLEASSRDLVAENQIKTMSDLKRNWKMNSFKPSEGSITDFIAYILEEETYISGPNAALRYDMIRFAVFTNYIGVKHDSL